MTNQYFCFYSHEDGDIKVKADLSEVRGLIERYPFLANTYARKSSLHAHANVQWFLEYEWGKENFSQAKAEDDLVKLGDWLSDNDTRS